MLSRVNIGSSNQLVPGVQRTYTGLTANGVYRFTANVNYLSTGGGGIGGFSAGEMSSLVTTSQDSLVISYTNGSGVSITIAKLRYNISSSFLASLTFTVPSGVTAIKAEFVPGNTSGVAGYGYFVDNLRLARMTGAGFYMSNFVTTSISASNTDGWSTNWATSYMNVLAGPPNKLRASGQLPAISRNFSVTPNDACAFTYTQSENNSVNLIIEQSPNGTSGWSTLMNITSVNGTHVRNFTPTQAYVRVRMSGSVAFSLADVTLKSAHVDMTVVEIPGKSGYRYSFQGQEHDDEIKGAGNSINFEYRMHDPRIGRFFSIDPLTAKYPHYTPYSFSGNKVIDHVELEGLEEAKPKEAGAAPVLTPIAEMTVLKGGAEAAGESFLSRAGSGVLGTFGLVVGFVLKPTSMGTGDMIQPAPSYFEAGYSKPLTTRDARRLFELEGKSLSLNHRERTELFNLQQRQKVTGDGIAHGSEIPIPANDVNDARNKALELTGLVAGKADFLIGRQWLGKGKKIGLSQKDKEGNIIRYRYDIDYDEEKKVYTDFHINVEKSYKDGTSTKYRINIPGGKDAYLKKLKELNK